MTLSVSFLAASFVFFVLGAYLDWRRSASDRVTTAMLVVAAVILAIAMLCVRARI